MNDHNLEAIINSHKVLICVGSGGVGKTTVSAAIAVRAAQIGKKVLVLTIDPALRLKVALGLDGGDGNTALVPDQKFKGQLYASLLNPEKIFLEFIGQSAVDPIRAQKLVKNRLYEQLSTTLSGSQEFTSLLQLSRIVSANEYDLIVLDTPPAQHAIDFLEAPERIGSLFKDSIVKWFLVQDQKEKGLIKKIISRGTKTALAALEYITGSIFMSELNDFFQSVGTVQNQISEITIAARQILTSTDTAFLLITGFNEIKLAEANHLKKYLDERGYNLEAVILNRSVPSFSAEHFNGTGLPKLDVLRFAEYNSLKEKQFQKFINNCEEHLLIVRTADFNEDITKLSGLVRFADELDNAFKHAVARGLRTNG